MSAHYEEVLVRLRVELYAAAQLFRGETLDGLRQLVGEVHDLLKLDDGNIVVRANGTIEVRQTSGVVPLATKDDIDELAKSLELGEIAAPEDERG